MVQPVHLQQHTRASCARKSANMVSILPIDARPRNMIAASSYIAQPLYVLYLFYFWHIYELFIDFV